jgi:hypothetical protein
MHIVNFLPDLPHAVTREVFANLCNSLPQPRTNSPDELADRNETAVAAVAALHPGDAFEAVFAAQIVNANAQAMACCSHAAQPGLTPKEVHYWRGQAAVMMRLMQSGLRSLRRDRAAREKAEAERNPAAMERAGYYFRDVSVPAPDAAPPPAEAAPDEVATIVADAETYALAYPRRAARIRAAGGVPRNLDFGLPPESVMDMIIAGTTPALLALDIPTSQASAAAD